MKFCTYCGQNFTRTEHLERHILTHTKVKPHKCSICYISFARRDLLRKHLKSHGDVSDDAANGLEVDNSTSRALVACESCVKRKVKCDNSYPCSRCATRGLTCNSRAFQKHRGTMNSRNTQLAATHPQNLDNGPDSISVPSVCTPLPSPVSSGQQLYESHVSEPPEPSDDPPNCQAALPGRSLQESQPSVPTSVDANSYRDIFPDNDVDELTAPGYLNVLDMDSYFLMDWSEGPMHMTQMGLDTQPNDCIPVDPMNSVNSGALGFQSFDNLNGTTVRSPHYHEHREVIMSREHWNFFKCNQLKPAGTCPKTARVLLQSLGAVSEEQDLLMSWNSGSLETGSLRAQIHSIELLPIFESTRDKLLAVSQGFLLKAYDIHSIGDGENEPQLPTRSDRAVGLLSLPSIHRLEELLRSFLRNFNTFYSTFPAGKMDVNSLMMLNNHKTAALLVLLAVAEGAMAEPSAEGFRLSGGLTEVCRISLFDMIEKDILLARDQLVLQSALIFTIQASWSGDKWLMDIGAGQRGIYVAMLRHGGILEPLAAPASIFPNITSLDHAWNVWQLHESRVRLIYSWVLSDQEHSLFNDRAPLISVTELNAVIANADELWYAKTAAHWQEILVQNHEYDTTSLPGVVLPKQKPSLFELFSKFLNDDLSFDKRLLSPLMLRLLLYPIQGQVCHMRQLLTCFTPHSSTFRAYRTVSRTSVQLRLEEVQSLLYRWFSLWQSVLSEEEHALPTSQATLIIYHLLRLDTISSFGMIEKAAREYPQVTTTKRYYNWSILLQEPREAVIQAGQALRIATSMPKDTRPPWWPASIYRAALILWAYASSTSMSTAFLTQSSNVPEISDAKKDKSGDKFRIDVILDTDDISQRFEKYNVGCPTLVDENGNDCSLRDPIQALQLCITILDQGVTTRFSEGIKTKLRILSESC